MSGAAARPAGTARGELWRALALLSEPVTSAHADIARLLELPPAPTAAEQTELFVLELLPYASIHLDADGMLGGEPRDRAAGFWRALGLTPPREPDALATLLRCHADLAERADSAAPASRARWQHARQAFFWEHVASWLPLWLANVGRSRSAFYRAWAALLGAALGEEAGAVGAPAALPFALRQAPAPLMAGLLSSAADTGPDADALVHALLAPVRSGVVVTRSALAAAAAGLGVGVRLGERRRALRDLWAHDPAGTMDWLAAHARWQADALAHSDPRLATVTGWWRARSQAWCTGAVD